MKKRLLFASVTTLLSLSLCACGATQPNTVKTSRVAKQTVGAVKAEDTNVISLTDGTIKLPQNYRYIFKDDGDLKSYFVFNPDKSNEIADRRDGRKEGEYEEVVRLAWERAKAEAEKKAKGLFGIRKKTDPADDVFVFDTTAYSTPYNENTYMYVFEGVDRATPDEELSDSDIKTSISSYIQNSIGANLTLEGMLIDSEPVPKSPKGVDSYTIDNIKWLYDEALNGDYYALTFTAYFGDYMSSTYSALYYPFTYYGIFYLEKDCTQGIRRWYGFVFANDSEGGHFNEDEYTNLLRQIKGEFGVTTFYTNPWNKQDNFYDADKDYRSGRDYSQYAELLLGTSHYYLMCENKSRDINGLTDEEIKADDSITVIDFDFNDMSEKATETAETK